MLISGSLKHTDVCNLTLIIIHPFSHLFETNESMVPIESSEIDRQTEGEKKRKKERE